MARVAEAKIPSQAEVAPQQTKYRTFEEFRRGVRSVRGVTKGERLQLGVLADYANYHTAQSRPGNERLQQETGLAESGVSYVSKSLITKKLVVLVSGGKSGAGRGHANVFRICVEDDRFPVPKQKDKTPSAAGGIKTPSDSMASHGITHSVSDPKTPSEYPENPQYGRENPQSDCYPSLDSSLNTSLNKTSAAKTAADFFDNDGPVSLDEYFTQQAKNFLEQRIALDRAQNRPTNVRWDELFAWLDAIAVRDHLPSDIDQFKRAGLAAGKLFGLAEKKM